MFFGSRQRFFRASAVSIFSMARMTNAQAHTHFDSFLHGIEHLFDIMVVTRCYALSLSICVFVVLQMTPLPSNTTTNKDPFEKFKVIDRDCWHSSLNVHGSHPAKAAPAATATVRTHICTTLSLSIKIHYLWIYSAFMKGGLGLCRRTYFALLHPTDLWLMLPICVFVTSEICAVVVVVGSSYLCSFGMVMSATTSGDHHGFPGFVISCILWYS